MINTQDNAIKARQRMIARMYRKDTSKDEDIEWITTKTGQHVPLIDGEAVGGPMKGEDFSKAESKKNNEKRSESKKSQLSNRQTGLQSENKSNIFSDMTKMSPRQKMNHIIKALGSLKVGDAIVISYNDDLEIDGSYTITKMGDDSYSIYDEFDFSNRDDITTDEIADGLESDFDFENIKAEVIAKKGSESQSSSKNSVKKAPIIEASEEGIAEEEDTFKSRKNCKVPKFVVLNGYSFGNTYMRYATLCLINRTDIKIEEGNESNYNAALKRMQFCYDDLYGKRYGYTVYHETWHAIDDDYSQMTDASSEEVTDFMNKHYLRRSQEFGFSKDVVNRGIAGMARFKHHRQLSVTYVLKSGKTFFETYLEEFKDGDINKLIEEASNAPYGIGSLLSDSISFKTQGKKNDILRGGYHHQDYWEHNFYHGALEMFANIAAAKAADDEGYELLKKHFPKTVDAYDEILGDIKSGKIAKS